MARPLRVEIEGGLYHVITRGNNRQTIFHSADDCEKFISLLSKQKYKLPYFLYAYCLMSNHVHLLIERQAAAIGRIMHRVLTGYSQYYNRRYQKVGHLLQGRHKAILCQSETYLSELVRYIHLNPVRAKMVCQPEDYEYGSHRSYIGLAPAGIVDVDPVLRHFGARREIARKEFRRFVLAGMKDGHRQEFCLADEGRMLGSDEFVESMTHRIGQSGRRVEGRDRNPKRLTRFDATALFEAVEKNFGETSENICSKRKSAELMRAKEALILVGRKVGATVKELSGLVNIGISGISRRHDNARQRAQTHREFRLTTEQIEQEYLRTTNSK